MKKLNWVLDLLALIEERKSAPFIWGQNDCVLFAADCIVVMGNVDPAAASRGKYKTEQGAKRHLASVYGDLYKAWDSKLERLDNINFVQNGDVAVYDSELGLTSGIYWNGGVFAPSETGVILLTEMHHKILAAWRV